MLLGFSVVVLLRSPLGYFSHSAPNRARFRNFTFTRRPSFALLGAIAIGFFGLVVKQNLPRGIRQIDAVFHKLFFNSTNYLVARSHIVNSARRSNPPPNADIDGTFC